MKLRSCICPDEDESDDEEMEFVVVSKQPIQQVYRPSILCSLMDKIQYRQSSDREEDWSDF